MLVLALLIACTAHDDTPDTAAAECLVDAPDAMVLDLVTAISAPAGGIETVSFTTAEPVSLDVSTALGGVWHDMLQFSIDYDEPVYLRIDPGTRAIVDVLRSFDGVVVSIHDDVDFVAVAFTTSQAIHELRRDSACFNALDAKLASALGDGSTVLVSESDEDGIVDVRPPL